MKADRLSIHKFRIPIALLALVGLVYGTLAPQLGYYWDDWPLILMTKAGIRFADFFQYNRPLSYWIYSLAAPFLGIQPVNWHLFSLALWWLVSVAFWATLSQLWPENRMENGFAALLFAVHPAFFQHATAVAFSQHFTTYLLFLVSTWSMLAYLRHPSRPPWLAALSIVTAVLHLLTMEYYWGLELLRPIMIWMVLGRPESGRSSAKRVIANWWPYLVILLGVLAWRIFFFQGVEDPNSLALLEEIQAQPFNGTLAFFEALLRDVLNLLITSWFPALSTDLIDFQTPSLLASWGLVLAVVLSAAWFFLREARSLESPRENRRWALFVFGFGAAAMIAAMLPAWLVGRELTVGKFSNRLALPALFGVSICLVALVSWLIASRKAKIWLLSILVGLAAGAQFRIINDYRWAWTEQQRVFWQMHWRMPQLASGTAILSEGALFTYTGEYPTAVALNTLYAGQTGRERQDYWFFEIDRNFLFDPKPVLNNGVISGNIHNIYYEGMGSDVLLVAAGLEGQCLWVLDEEDQLNPWVPEISRPFLQVSSPDRIRFEGDRTDETIIAIFGQPPAPDWCYYYQQAERAGQQADWDRIADIYAQVRQASLTPNFAVEWQPFVEGLALSENWREAREATLAAYESDGMVAEIFCSIWEHAAALTPASEARDEFISQVYDELRCRLYGE